MINLMMMILLCSVLSFLRERNLKLIDIVGLFVYIGVSLSGDSVLPSYKKKIYEFQKI